MEFKCEGIIDSLLKNKNAIDLVKSMKPIGIVKVLASDLDLSPHDASRVALELIKKTEGISSPGIEPNMQFPVPATIDKSGKPLLKIKRGTFVTDPHELDELGVPMGKSVNSPRFTIKRHHFPPDPIGSPGDWPYDGGTKAAMEPKNRAPKRGMGLTIHASNDPLFGDGEKNIRLKFKDPLSVNLRANQPGTYGTGIQRKSAPHNKGNTQGTSGNSVTTRGTPGWSKSLGDKEFNDPNDPEVTGRTKAREGMTTNHPPNAGDNDDIPAIFQQDNTGVSWPIRIGQGGHSEPRQSSGHRGYGRR